MSTEHYVYILSNASRCFYIGMTRDPPRRWYEHKERTGAEFTKRYHLHVLLYLRQCPDRASARAHEQSLKRRSRARKWAIIRAANPELRDLSVAWGWRKGLDSRDG
jgi:putative endonuclease